MGVFLTAEAALQRVGEVDKLHAVAPFWEESQAAFPVGGPDFLKPVSIHENRMWCGFDEEVEAVLVRVAAAIREHPALVRLAWHCWWRLYEGEGETAFDGWPDFEAALGDDRGVFYLLVGIGEVPRMRALHTAWGIPEAVTRETCQEPNAFCYNHTQMHGGRIGIARSTLFWLRHYTREPYFRLGRLEFWLKPFGENIRVFRRRSSDEVAALAPEGERFDAQGFMPVESAPAAEGDWLSTYQETPGWVEGNPILPTGRAVSTLLRLNLGEWERVLEPGRWVLDMHIPAGGKMSPEAVRESMMTAREFFAKYFPDKTAAGFVCWSWIFSPVLDQILPEESNLVKNMHEVYLFPYASDPQDGLGFVFYQDNIDLTTAPRKTSVQRAFLDYLLAGKNWRAGGMFYLMDDLDDYGKQVYRHKRLFTVI